MVDLAPWAAKSRAMSIIGIWWPPPTKGKKHISTLGASEAIESQREKERKENGEWRMGSIKRNRMFEFY